MTGKKLNGLVYEIGNTAQTRGLGTQEEVTNFQVKIRIIDAEKHLRPGMSMNATVETETRVGVLAVPLQSVTVRMPEMPMGDGEGGDEEEAPPVQTTGERPGKKQQMKPKEVVFLVEDSKAKTFEVTRGISDDSYTEIVSGLKEGGDVVSGSYKAINRELKDGSTVRVDNGGGPGGGPGGDKPDPQ
jgi:HlyD family secretion protein